MLTMSIPTFIAFLILGLIVIGAFIGVLQLAKDNNALACGCIFLAVYGSSATVVLWAVFTVVKYLYHHFG